MINSARVTALLCAAIAACLLPLKPQAATPIPAPPTLNAKGFLLIDQATGRVLAENNADEVLEPASLTKIMTAYVVFGELQRGRISLDEEVTVSEKAWRTEGSRMFIEVGKQVRVEDLLQGMIVQSGNDASVALAEHVAGSEEVFAAMMNETAKRLGMVTSNFQNATGLPGDEHYTTARDMSRLAQALITDFPGYYGRWYSQKEFTYNGISQSNRNALLWRDPTVDGIKTGMTKAAGYCLISSAKRDGMRLISVVMGTPSAKVRASASQALLNYGFRFFESRQLFAAGQEITTVRVWKSSDEQARLGLERPLVITIPRGQADMLEAEMDLRTPIVAPVATDEILGRVRVMLADEVVAEEPLLALEPVQAGDFIDRAMDEIRLWFE